MKVLLHFRAGPLLRERLKQVTPAGMRIVIVDEVDDAGFAAEIADTDVLLHVLRPVTEAMIAAAPRLRLIQKIGVGVNTIDLKAAAARGIAVANMPGTNSQAVAEQTLALMLAVLRRTVMLDRVTREGGGWSLPPEVLESTGEIYGRTVGLIGYGEVPRRLAPVLQALGATVAYTATKPKAGAVGQYLDLDALLRTSDIVSLHLPLTDATRNLIDAAALEKLKPGAVLINTARGGLVDERALERHLRSGRLRGAGLDVFSVEPVRDHPLFGLDAVTVAPHVAWLTPETIDRSFGVALENVRRLAAGEALLNLIRL